MITLADLAAVHAEHAAAWRAPVEPVRIARPEGEVVIGDDAVTLMGCVNLSRDSTYRESVAVSADDAVRMGRIQAAQGAAIIDLGAESSIANAVRVSAEDQVSALVPAVEGLARDVVVSVETYEPSVVRACLRAGAQVLNMTGREHEPAMLDLAAEHDAVVVMCFGQTANVRDNAAHPLGADPLPMLIDHFGPRLEEARRRGATRVVIDPGMGFTYRNLTGWRERSTLQTTVLMQSFRLRALGVPVCNVLPHTFDLFGDEFRKAEGFFATFAALGGSQLLRVHEVPHLRVVLRALEALSVR